MELVQNVWKTCVDFDICNRMVSKLNFLNLAYFFEGKTPKMLISPKQ